MSSNVLGSKGLGKVLFRGFLFAGFVLAFIACAAGHKPLADAAPDFVIESTITPAQIAQFEPEILAFDTVLMSDAEPKEGIVFSGSSSIRKWDSLQRDMAPLPVVNRGFGGAIIKQVTHHATRMIVPLRPKLIVFYCGENDIANDKYPAEMALNDFKAFTASMRQKLPGTGIIFISMKPSPLRWKYWPKFQEANRMIKTYIETQPRMWYLDVSKDMLNPRGMPRPELFASDSLHMSADGYSLWTKILKPKIEAKFVELDQK